MRMNDGVFNGRQKEIERTNERERVLMVELDGLELGLCRTGWYNTESFDCHKTERVSDVNRLRQRDDVRLMLKNKLVDLLAADRVPRGRNY